MLIFFDETFRDSLKHSGVSFGALCGVAILENQLHKVASDIYQLKHKHFGAEFARDSEIKGKELLKNYVFSMAARGIESRNLALAKDLLAYMEAKGIHVFGCVCFEKEIKMFKCEDVASLDITFRYVFERIDMYMKIKHQGRMAKIIFDDRDYGTNKQNATAITNFFLRSAVGLSFDSIIKTPFFAISQAAECWLATGGFCHNCRGVAICLTSARQTLL
jgi:hypothetical protein